MAKKFSNFRLISPSTHPLGLKALMDIEAHGDLQTVLIAMDKTTHKWHYSSGSNKELPHAVVNQLMIPDDLSKPFWYQACDSGLVTFTTRAAKVLTLLGEQLEQNEKQLTNLRRGSSRDLTAHVRELTDEREKLRTTIRELMNVMVMTTHSS